MIGPEEYADILRLAPNEEFRDLIAFAWETGVRAAECLAIKRRHVDLERARIVFPRDEEKMRRTRHHKWASNHDYPGNRLGTKQSFNEIVHEAVHTKWDPIGIGKSALEYGEYDHYVSGICKLLMSKPSEAEVFAYLWTIETESIGLHGNHDATEQFAKWLCTLKVT